MLGILEIEQIAARTRALGMQGHVAISHAYSLGDVAADVVHRTAATLATSGVAIMTNAPGARPFPPVKLLRAAGVTVFGGCDNIRDSWWPYGDGDMLGRAMMIGYRSGFNTDEDLALAFDIVTQGGAKALRVVDYGLRVGATADFVTLDAPHVPQAVVDVPKARSVYKNGRQVVKAGKLISARSS
jgi:cytosine deaminase